MSEAQLFGYVLTGLSMAPILALITMQLRSRRLSVTAAVGALSSTLLFSSMFILPWTYYKDGYVYLYDMDKIMGIVGETFSRLLILSAAFALLGATLWLAEIVGGREVFTLASSAGFTITLGLILSITLIAYENLYYIKHISLGAWLALILYCVNITLSIVKGRVAIYNKEFRGRETMVEDIIKEAKKIVQNRAQ